MRLSDLGAASGWEQTGKIERRGIRPAIYEGHAGGSCDDHQKIRESLAERRRHGCETIRAGGFTDIANPSAARGRKPQRNPWAWINRRLVRTPRTCRARSAARATIMRAAAVRDKIKTRRSIKGIQTSTRPAFGPAFFCARRADKRRGAEDAEQCREEILCGSLRLRVALF